MLQAQQFIDYILVHQTADGWLGPTDRSDGNCYWSKFPLLLALRQVGLHCCADNSILSVCVSLQYAEANTSDARVIPAMIKFLNASHKLMFTIPLGSDTWSVTAVSGCLTVPSLWSLAGLLLGGRTWC